MATVGSITIDSEKWEYYKHRRHVPLWTAVALTLDLDPRRGERVMLENLDNGVRETYKQRKKIAISRYGMSDGLKAINHHAERQTEAGRYVSLLDMIEFAQVIGWHKDGSLAPMQRTFDIVIDEESSLQADQSEKEEDQFGKGAGYRAVRMGALLDLISQWIKKDRKIPEIFVSGQTLSIDAVAKELEAQINKMALANGFAKKVPAQGSTGIRKQFGEDQKAFAEVGRNKKNNRRK